ncbi:MAG: T9SS type A sorting domain-containing protein, partial [Paludibacter sp.]
VQNVKQKIEWNVQANTLIVRNIAKNAYLTLYNASGKIVCAQQYNSTCATIQLSKPGLYLLKITGKEGSETLKILR